MRFRFATPVWALLTIVLALPGRPDDQRVSGTALDERTLLSHGFVFDPERHGTCSISGSDGYCEVEAFVWSEKSKDPLKHTCAKLNKATYVGSCVGGALEGVAVVIADGTGKQSREAFVSYFSRGRIAYPALTAYLTDSSGPNLGVYEVKKSYGCVYFGRWDRSDEREGCRRIKDIFGPDILSETNAQALRSNSFDLRKYRSRLMAFASRPH